jgi:hypothetical protein
LDQDPVTIASATNEIVVPPTQQSWSCSCKYGFPDYLHLPVSYLAKLALSNPLPAGCLALTRGSFIQTGIEEVWKLDRHVSRGELVGPFLNHHKYTWSGANLIHWELKAHLILGLEGSDFWVGGSKVELVREDFYEEGDQGEPSASRDPETGRLIDWLTGGGDIGCGD